VELRWFNAGAEYIILEKTPAKKALEVCDSMSESSRLVRVEQLAKLENKLACVQFPTVGSQRLLFLNREN
jgi:hypothetical protein